MSRIEHYRQVLRNLADWKPYFLAESGLPRPRGNIELAQAVADEGDGTYFLRLLAFDADRAPVNTPQEFLVFCSAVGLGRLLAGGRHDLLPLLRRHANDPRWRMRAGVAMVLQRWDAADMLGQQTELMERQCASPRSRRALDHAAEPPQATADPCRPRLGRGVAGKIGALIEGFYV